jgi:hypothetical protein
VNAYTLAISREAKVPAAWAGLVRAYTQLGRDDEARQARARLEDLDSVRAGRSSSGATAAEGVAR